MAGTRRRFFLIFPCFLFLPAIFPAAQELTRPISPNMEEQRRAITEEASPELVKMTIYDSEVSLIMNGFWKGSLSFNWGVSSGPMGVMTDSNDSPLLFTQEADLTLSLWIREKWFLEVSFLDDYDLNTYRAGYQGFPGETVQYVGVGNTGLNFPVFPYLDLGGESPSSFGAYGRFGGGGLTLHTLVRYDAAAREERIFVGNRERSFGTVSPENTVRGLSFVLPGENLASVPVVYFEDENGEFSGGGKNWRLARSSEYAASGIQGLVELAAEPRGMVAVSYNSGSGTYASFMGNYAAGVGFLWDVQEHFDNARTSIKLEDYPQPGQRTAALGSFANVPAVLTIGGVSALVIYEPGTFSPFERQSRYRSSSSTSEDAALVKLSSGERVPGYELLPVDDFLTNLPLYGITGSDSRRGLYELSPGAGRERRTPGSMWPLVRDASGSLLYPELYLPGKHRFSGDLRIRFTNYGPAGAYTIGTDVVPGSVQVYRGGLLDSQVTYNAGSGTVQLGSPAGFNEVIRITYLKRSEDRRLGSLAAGLGLVYQNDSPFSAMAALGLRWNVAGETFTEEGAASPGTVGFGGKVRWDYEKLHTELSLGLGFEQPDTTGLYRIAGMEGNSEIIMALSASSGFLSETPDSFPPSFTSTWGSLVPLIYRNYRSSDIFGVSTMHDIDWSAPRVSGMSGPYPAAASELNTQVFAAEFENMNNGDWTGFQVPLGTDGALLESAKQILIPFRFYGFASGPPSPSDLEISVQFGSLKDENSSGTENPNLITTKLIYGPSASPSPDPSLPNWYRGIVDLTDADRRSLQNARYMRIIVKNISGAPLSGRVLTAKPIIYGSSWRAITVNANEITAADDATAAVPSVAVRESSDPSLRSRFPREIDRLHPGNGRQQVLEVKWENPGSSVGAGADGRTGSIPLSDYRTLSFFIKGPIDDAASPPVLAPGSLRFIIAGGPDSIKRPLLEAEIPLTDPVTMGSVFSGGWSRVELRYRDNKITVNGHSVSGGSVHYYPGALSRDNGDLFLGDGTSSYIAIFVTDTGPGAPPAKGGFSLDEICLEDPVPAYRVNAGAALEYTNPGILVSAGGKPVLSALYVNTVLESGARGDPFNGGSETFSGAQSRSNAGITFLGARLTGNLSFRVSNDTSYWSGGHGISRAFGPLSVSESFNTAPEDKSMNHELAMNLGTTLYGQASSSLRYENERINRRWSASTGINAVQNEHPGFLLTGDLSYQEKSGEPENWMPNYAETWAMSWTRMIPDTGSRETMRNRDAHGRAGFNLNRTPLGMNLNVDGTSSVSIPQRMTQSATTGTVDLPFTLGFLQGNFRNERTIRRNLDYTGSGIFDDLGLYGESIADSGPLWLNLPIYAIFDPALGNDLDSTLDNYRYPSLNTSFREAAALGLRFPERYDVLSLVIPASFSARVDRALEQRLDTRFDVLTLSSSLGFTGINLFGSMGVKPLFSFYRNDEFRHSIGGIISIPRHEDPVWRIQAEQNLGFFGLTGAELSVTNTITAGSTGWLESLKLLWTVPAERTLLSSIYDMGMSRLADRANFPALSSLAETEYERFRRESLELVIDRTGGYGVYSCVVGHESLVRIMGRLNLSAFSKLAVSRSGANDTLSFLLTLGTALTISF